MENIEIPKLPLELFNHMINNNTISIISLLCKALHKICHPHLLKNAQSHLRCINIDFDYIKLYAPLLACQIYGTTEDLEYLAEEIKKYYYYGYYDSYIDVLFQNVLNYFIANSRVDIYKEITSKCGLYCYRGSDGDGETLPDLFIAARYSDISTFTCMFKQFIMSSENFDYDNYDVRTQDFLPEMKDPEFIKKTAERRTKEEEKRIQVWSEKNHQRIDRPGNIADCDYLLLLAEMNPHKEVYDFLIEYKYHKFVSFYWFDDKNKHTDITEFLGISEDGYIIAVPKKCEYEDLNKLESFYAEKLKSSEVGYLENIKIYRIVDRC